MNTEEHRTPVVWRPQPRQAEFMRRPEPEALYGGAAGGGKSDALVIEALRQVDIPHYRALILRKTYPQLSDLVDKSQMYYRRAFPQAQYNATAHVWNFPSGAKIYFGSMQYTKDRTNYQGKAYDFIGFDELTHFEWEEYSYMMSRNRPTGPGTRVYMRATTNPGGIGHGWVKARFITPAPPGTPIVEEYTVRRPDGTEQKLQRARVFIPSSIFDNPALLQNDPGYLASPGCHAGSGKAGAALWQLGQLFRPGVHRVAQRPGPLSGSALDPRHCPVCHSQALADLPGFDFGFSKPFSVGWYAADEEGRLYRIKELYGCTGRPNEGLRIDPVEQARRIREAEQNDPVLRGRVIHGVADPAIFDESRGEQSMMDLQMFAEEAAPAALALSPAQARQAVASGTMEPGRKLRSRCRKQNRIRSRPNRRRPSRSCPARRCRPAAAGPETRCGSCMPAGRLRKPTCAAASRSSACRRS